MWVTSNQRNTVKNIISLGGGRIPLGEQDRNYVHPPHPSRLSRDCLIMKTYGSPFCIKSPEKELSFLQNEVNILKSKCEKLEKMKSTLSSKQDIEEIVYSTGLIQKRIQKVLQQKSETVAPEPYESPVKKLLISTKKQHRKQSQKTTDQQDSQNYQSVMADLQKSVSELSIREQSNQALRMEIKQIERQNGELSNCRLELRRKIQKLLDI